MIEEQFKRAATKKVQEMSLVDKQGRYLELGQKIAALVILSKAELAELIILRDSLQRDARK